MLHVARCSLSISKCVFSFACFVLVCLHLYVRQCVGALACVCLHSCVSGFVSVCAYNCQCKCVCQRLPQLPPTYMQDTVSCPPPKRRTKHHPPKTMHAPFHFDVDNCTTQNVLAYKGVASQMGLLLFLF